MKALVYFIMFLQHCFTCLVLVDETSITINFLKPIPARYLEPVVTTYYIARGCSLDSLELSKDSTILPWLRYRVYVDKQFRFHSYIYVLDDFISGKRVLQSIKFNVKK